MKVSTLSLAAVLGLFGLTLLVLSFSPALLGALLRIDKGFEEQFIPTEVTAWPRLLQGYAALLLSAAALALAADRSGVFEKMFLWESAAGAVWTLLCSGMTLFLLSQLSYDSQWYRLSVLINDSETLEVFSRRLLLIWPARWLHAAAPSLSYLRVYWCVQAPVILVMMVLIRMWSAQFMDAGKAHIGQILAVFLLVPTFSYYTFYDLAIVLFYTGALIALWKRRYVVFALLVGVGALNHENTLLLLFVAGAVCYRREPHRKVAQIIGSSLLLWVGARAWITLAVPMKAAVHIRIFTNLWELVHAPEAMGVTGLAWLPLLLFTVLGWRAAPENLRKASIALIIPLLAVTYLFGKFREPRQLDAYIPLAIAFGICTLRPAMQMRALAHHNTHSFEAQTEGPARRLIKKPRDVRGALVSSALFVRETTWLQSFSAARLRL